MVTDTVLLLLFVVPEFIVLFILGLDIFEFAHILTASFMIGGPKPPTTTSGKEKFWYFFGLTIVIIHLTREFGIHHSASASKRLVMSHSWTSSHQEPPPRIHNF